MKRIKADCILQALEQTLTCYQIDREEEQENGSIIVRIRKQYNSKADASEYFQ